MLMPINAANLGRSGGDWLVQGRDRNSEKSCQVFRFADKLIKARYYANVLSTAHYRDA